MSDLAMYLSALLLVAVVGGVIFFVYVITELQRLKSQVSYDRHSAQENYHSAQENYNAQWKRIEYLRDQHEALEKYLGIEYVKRSESCYTKTKAETNEKR